MAELYEDLLKDSSESFEDGNYFLLTITELELVTTYPLQFRWKYKDGTSGKDWSAVYNINTPGSTVPNEPDLDAGDVIGGAGFISVTWNGNDATNNPIQNIDRVDVHISGTSFGDGTKPAGSFKTSGTQTFSAEPGIYIVQLKAYRVDGASSFFSTARTVTVTAIEELIEAPIVPTGFSARAILGGIEITWNGTYTGGATWSGFQAVNIYAGTSTSATGGTYIKVGQMTANKVSNKIVIPIDGTYVRYGFPAYIHASSVNKATPPVESSISANVANATPSQVVNTDLIDAVISEAKLALNAVTETKIATDAITTPKIVASAITGGKIAALAITGDKIAANTIDVGKLVANTISVGNLSAGDINATSYIRAGSAGSARVEIASTTVGTVLPGLTVYDSGGNQMLRAPLTGGLTITGALTATSISTSSGNFSVNSSGIMSATSGSFNGTITATGGSIGGIYIASASIQNDSGGSQFKIDSSGKARFGSATGNAIVINPTASNGGYYLYHTSGGHDGSASSAFNVSTSGILTATGGNFSGAITNGSDYWNAAGSFRIGGSSGIDYDKSSGVIKIGGSNGIVYNGSNQVTIGTTGNQVTINTSTGNVSIAGTLTANALSLSSGDFWNSNGDFQLGGLNGLTYSANAIQIGYWRIGVNPAGSNYGVLFGKDLDVFLHADSAQTYAMVTNSRGIAIATAMSPSSIAISTGGAISAGGRVVGVGTSGNRSEFSFLNIISRMSITGGYGIDSDWSPQSDNTYDLGQAPSNRWRRLYSNNTTISTSDIRLKTNIIDSPLGLNFINSLRPVAYKWIEGSKEIAKDEDGNEIQIGTDSYGKPIYQTISIPGVRRHYGFIAQEVKEAIDDAGIDDFAGWVKDNLSDPESYQSLSYEQFTAPVVKAIQELSQKISSIESRLDALEG